MIERTMLSLPGRFRPKMAGNFRAVIQFYFSGGQPDNWILTIGDGQCQVAEGIAESPNATVIMDTADFIGINNGDIPASQLFWGGAIDIEGEVEAVISLAPIMGW